MKKRPFSNNANQVLETAFDAFPSKLIPYKHTMLVKYVHSFCASFNGPILIPILFYTKIAIYGKLEVLIDIDIGRPTFSTSTSLFQLEKKQSI